jgi:hypothetical protein
MQSKTYFWTNQLNNVFPPEFIASKNQRYIVVEQCKATYKDQLVGDVIMHADFIQRDHYMDYACCFVNEQPNRDTAKYEFKNTGNKNSFNIWFTDLYGNNIEVDAFALRLLLIY